MKNEIKKLFGFPKIILIFAILILAQTVLSSITFEPTFLSDQEKKVYAEISGPHSVENEQFLIREREKAYQARQTIEEAEQRLIMGEIAESEYIDILTTNSPLANSVVQMDTLYNQYLSIRGNPQKAHFLF